MYNFGVEHKGIHRLIDEFLLMVHPEIAGNMHLTLVRTQSFRSGAVLLCYVPSAVQA